MPLNQLVVPTPDETRDGILRTEKAGLAARGVVANVTKGSEAYTRATALGNELAVVHANAIVRADAAMPDTAVGADLDRVALLYGLRRRVAIGASGNAVYETTITPGLIATGAQLIDTSGNVFAVTTGGLYGDKAQTAVPSLIPIRGVSTGKGTNHGQGDYLTWVSAPAGAANKIKVGPGGLTGGTALEKDDALRARLLERIAHPPAGGNSEQVIGWALDANPGVEAAYAYPGLDGPSTYGVSVTGALTRGTGSGATTRYTRVLSGLVTQSVGNALAGEVPEHANLNTQLGTVDQLVSVAVGLTLPDSRIASPPGPGGGWTDATPWPALLGGATRVYVESFTSGTQFVLTSNAAGSCPSSTGLVAGQTKIAWLDPLGKDADGNDWPVFKVATVASVLATTTGHIEVTLDSQTPFANIGVGHYVCPAAEKIADYGEALLRSIAVLGPGQRTADANRLPRAYRRPLVAESHPSDLTAVQLRAVTDVGAEVLDVSWLYESTTTPTVPGATTTAVNVLVPLYLGFYKI